MTLVQTTLDGVAVTAERGIQGPPAVAHLGSASRAVVPTPFRSGVRTQVACSAEVFLLKVDLPTQWWNVDPTDRAHLRCPFHGSSTGDYGLAGEVPWRATTAQPWFRSRVDALSRGSALARRTPWSGWVLSLPPPLRHIWRGGARMVLASKKGGHVTGEFRASFLL